MDADVADLERALEAGGDPDARPGQRGAAAATNLLERMNRARDSRWRRRQGRSGGQRRARGRRRGRRRRPAQRAEAAVVERRGETRPPPESTRPGDASPASERRRASTWTPAHPGSDRESPPLADVQHGARAVVARSASNAPSCRAPTSAAHSARVRLSGSARQLLPRRQRGAREAEPQRRRRHHPRRREGSRSATGRDRETAPPCATTTLSFDASVPSVQKNSSDGAPTSRRTWVEPPSVLVINESQTRRPPSSASPQGVGLADVIRITADGRTHEHVRDAELGRRGRARLPRPRAYRALEMIGRARRRRPRTSGSPTSSTARVPEAELDLAMVSSRSSPRSRADDRPVPGAIDAGSDGFLLPAPRARGARSLGYDEGNEDRERHICLDEDVAWATTRARRWWIWTSKDSRVRETGLADGVVFGPPSRAASIAAGGLTAESYLSVLNQGTHAAFRPRGGGHGPAADTIKVPETAGANGGGELDGKNRARGGSRRRAARGRAEGPPARPEAAGIGSAAARTWVGRERRDADL